MLLYHQLHFWIRAWRFRLKVERPEIAFVREHAAPGTTAVDIGAHKGAFTYWMQRCVGKAGSVVAFEPQPELASYVQQNTQAWRMSNVTVVNAAVSSKQGAGVIYRGGDQPSQGAHLVEGNAPRNGAFEIRLDTLDHYLASNSLPPVSLVKCDVEGHELSVFQGARHTLTVDRPALIFECEERHRGGSLHDVFEFLHELGYRGGFFLNGRLLPLSEYSSEYQKNPLGKASYANNFVFGPREKPVV